MNPLPAHPPRGYEAFMPRQAEPPTLVDVGADVFGRPTRLTPAAARAWRQMRDAAECDGCHLLLISAYRSVARQRELLGRKINAGASLVDALQVMAFPGHSEHHTGRAIDVGSPDCPHLGVQFESTPEFAWITQHACRFGFSLSYPRGNPAGIAYEPWHWLMRELHPRNRPGSMPS